MNVVNLITTHQEEKTMYIFFIADIGPDNFILGYPFLEANIPVVNWSKAKVEDTTTISTLDANNQNDPQEKKNTSLDMLLPRMVA